LESAGAYAEDDRVSRANSSASLAELRTRRAYECRLEPQRALRSVDEAAAFLADRGILTRTPDCSLPSLFEACHQPPYRPGRGGFADWPATGYPWFWELAQRDGVHELGVHDGKKVLVTAETAALADPVCRAELARAEAEGGDPALLLAHLSAAGPSPLDDLKVELDWDAARLRRARRPLERTGALVSHGVTLPGITAGHTHSSVLARWDQAFPQPSARGSLADVVVGCVRAAVLVPEGEPARWFSWRARPDMALIDALVTGGRLRRPAPGWLSLP
jgi:hypothetical protein